MSEDLSNLDRQHPLLLRVEQTERAILDTSAQAISSDKNVYHSTLFGLAVAKRSLGISNGFRVMVEHRNTACVVPLVRLQIDSALRLHAGELVRDAEAFCAAILRGEQIDRYKDAKNQPLKDRVLVASFVQRHPWIKEVYKQTSGGVHLSDRHILNLFSPAEDGFPEGTFRFLISPNDHDRDLEHYQEPMACMAHLNEILASDLQRWFSRRKPASPTHPVVPGRQ